MRLSPVLFGYARGGDFVANRPPCAKPPHRHPQGTDFSGEGKFLNLTGTSQEEKSSEGLPLDDGAAYGRIATSEIAIPQGINPNKETHHWHSSQRATPSWIWQHDSQNEHKQAK